MPSPFIGMDPYLEDPALWPSFQKAFMTCLFRVLQPSVGEHYHIRMGERPCPQQQFYEPFIEITSNDRLITLMDMVSPWNKTTSAGREAYLSTRDRARAAGAHLVDMDFVLQGLPLFDYSREGLPHWDYAVSIMRNTHPDRYEIYTATLQRRLPRFRVPLGANDRDAVVDAQAIFARCYEVEEYAKRINYHDLPPVLHDRIAVAAYHLWQKEGRPHGRDHEHWRTAMESLRQGLR